MHPKPISNGFAISLGHLSRVVDNDSRCVFRHVLSSNDDPCRLAFHSHHTTVFALVASSLSPSSRYDNDDTSVASCVDPRTVTRCLCGL
jgi:hypothetical protein